MIILEQWRKTVVLILKNQSYTEDHEHDPKGGHYGISWLAFKFHADLVVYCTISVAIYCIFSKVLKGVWIDTSLVDIHIFRLEKSVPYIQADLLSPMFAVTIFTIGDPFTVTKMFHGLNVLSHQSISMQIHFWFFYSACHLVIFLSIIGLEWLISHFDLPSPASHLLSSTSIDHGWTVTLTFASVVTLFIFAIQSVYSAENAPDFLLI